MGGVNAPEHEADPAAEIGLESGAAFCSSVGPEKVGDRIGRYKLLRKLGEGGCGIVYLAEQEDPVKRQVALKVIKLGMDTRQVLARFEAERQALALMDHPHIAKVLDGGSTSTGRPYFVMELVRGIPITRYCDEHELDTTQRLELFVLVCEAIQHAHQKGIIHRDIKPSNIMVTDHDGTPSPKVIDFGIAKATAGQTLTDKTLFTAFEQFIGTPAYMSPEQAKFSGVDIDTRSDIYSLGVLLYDLLTGKTPFESKRLMQAGFDEIRRIIQEEDPPRPSTRLSTLDPAEQTTLAKSRHCDPPKLRGRIRGDLDWIVMKTLEKDRSRRYETANGLAMDIERHLSNQPVVARPPSRLYEFQKMVRRHKPGFVAAGGIAAALIIGLAWMRSEERGAQERAINQLRLRELAEKKDAEARRLLYLANMNLAQQAWDQNNIGWLRQLLNDTRTSPDRGFEWYYWQKQCHQASKTLRGHLGAVISVAISKDGRRIATGSADKTVKIWDAASGRELLTLKGISDRVMSVAFSPDGQKIVTGGDKSAAVWETSTGRQLLRLDDPSKEITPAIFGLFAKNDERSEEITSVTFSADGKRIATGSIDRTARVWDAVSGRLLLTLRGRSNSVTSVAFSPDGQRIVTSADGTAKVWDATNGRELLTLTGHSNSVTSVAFSPDGQRIATGSEDGTAKVWAAANGRELLTFTGHSNSLTSVAFSPDGQRIVTGSQDKTAMVWDLASGQALLTVKGHSSWVLSAVFSPDGQWIVTASADNTAKVWEWEALPARETLTLKEYSSETGSVAFSPNGERVVIVSKDDTARVWDAASDAASGRELLTLDSNSNLVTSVTSRTFSPYGRRIATDGIDQSNHYDIRYWFKDGRMKRLGSPFYRFTSVAFSPDSKRIVTGSVNGTAKVWDATNGRELLTFTGHSNSVTSVAFSPDGQRIVTGSEDRTAKVWDATSGRELLTFPEHSNSITSVAFSPDGQRIVTGSEDRTAKVWNPTSGLNMVTLKGHNRGVNSVAFSPDGQRIVTGSDDRTTKVWDATSGRELLTLKGHNRGVYYVAFSPDGQRIVAGTADHLVKVWSAARPEEVDAWQEEER